VTRQRTAPALLEVSVRTLIEAEEAVADLLERLFHQSPTLYTDEATLVTRVSVYCPSRRAWSPARAAALRAGLGRIRAQGLPVGRTSIRTRWLRAQDWAESWKKHFRPLQIGDRLLIKPTWSPRRPRPGQQVVTLDPGLSFGTGQHPTTAFCLEYLCAFLPRPATPSFLDIGTGSGILAIAAAKLGYAPVCAFDNDPVAVRVARANARLNGVLKRIKLRRGDVRGLPLEGGARYDLICANLLHDLLVAESARIASRLRAGGRLVLAGILERQFGSVRAACERVGLVLETAATVKEWRSGVFVKKN